MRKTADKFLDESAATYREKSKEYGDNFLQLGHVLAAYFPGGITLVSPDDFNRFHLFMMKCIKDARYVQNWEKGGHLDSSLDASVYTAMLMEVDGMINSSQHVDPRDQPVVHAQINDMDDEQARSLCKAAEASRGHAVGTIVHRIEDTFDPPRYVGQDNTGE